MVEHFKPTPNFPITRNQKLGNMYGVTELQFLNLFDKAGKLGGVHGENFMILLEARLDKVVYRLGLARTRRAARQLVNLGHKVLNLIFIVNGDNPFLSVLN